MFSGCHLRLRILFIVLIDSTYCNQYLNLHKECCYLIVTFNSKKLQLCLLFCSFHALQRIALVSPNTFEIVVDLICH
jgi:hypothetical protein